MKIKSLIIISAFAMLVLGISCNRTPEVTFQSLLLEMTERDAITRFPDPSYSLRQFSSYDRKTIQPGNKEWFANWDRSMFIDVDSSKGRKEYIMYDAAGPGAVVRFWMTFAGQGAGEGNLRIYLDHQEIPVLEGNVLEILSGGLVTDGPLCASVSPDTNYKRRGHNFYLPIPYQQHCKITYESENITDPGARKGEAVYYNINYRTYEKGTRVATFDNRQLESADSLLGVVKKHLSQNFPTNGENYTSTSFGTVIPPGSSDTLKLDGSRAIRSIIFKFGAGPAEQLLRRTVLELNFDDEQTGWLPVGDLFGAGYQVNPYKTYYSKVSEDGNLGSGWIMPFEKSAMLILHNYNDFPVVLEKAAVIHSPYEWTNKSMHFGAFWHQYTDIYTGEAKNMEADGNPFDINFVTLHGQGIYVGDALTVFNTAYAWWGEGDEKIWVDQETFPSHIGTGTEDYYGYAWCRPEVFSHPFIAQPSGKGNFYPGYTQNIRHRILDRIPFNDSIKVDMELWHWTSTNINYAPTTFFYMKPGGTRNLQPESEQVKARIALRRSDLISPLVTNDMIEGENLVVDSIGGGRLSYQYNRDWGFSNNKQLWWTDGKAGDQLDLSFISSQAGKFELIIHYTKAPDYGKFQVYLNGERIGEIDGYHDEGVKLDNLSLGNYKLLEGENRLTLKITALSPKDGKGYVGIDRLTFKVSPGTNDLVSMN